MAQYECIPASIPPAMSMGVTEFMPRLKDGAPKLSPSGSPTFTSGVVVARPDGGVDRGVTIAVCEVPTKPWPMGTLLGVDGRCWITPYVDGAGRQGVSIIAERLAPVQAPGPRGKDGGE